MTRTAPMPAAINPQHALPGIASWSLEMLGTAGRQPVAAPAEAGCRGSDPRRACRLPRPLPGPANGLPCGTAGWSSDRGGGAVGPVPASARAPPGASPFARPARPRVDAGRRRRGRRGAGDGRTAAPAEAMSRIERVPAVLAQPRRRRHAALSSNRTDPRVSTHHRNRLSLVPWTSTPAQTGGPSRGRFRGVEAGSAPARTGFTRQSASSVAPARHPARRGQPTPGGVMS